MEGLQLVIWMLLSVALWWLHCVLSGRRGVRRVCDGGRKGVRDWHGALYNAFNRGREAARWQVHYSWGIPGGNRHGERIKSERIRTESS